MLLSEKASKRIPVLLCTALGPQPDLHRTLPTLRSFPLAGGGHILCPEAWPPAVILRAWPCQKQPMFPFLNLNL